MKLNLPNSYFEDEVREGFYIPSCVKQAWGAELEVLAAIDDLCAKYGIKYYADWGTFLGAVRHGGFIPWDDDMDIGMQRADYEKFLLHSDELPQGFCVYNLRNRKEHNQFLANVVNINHVCFEREHLQKYHGFPYIACVDIFIMDNVPDSEDAYQSMKDRAKLILGVSDSLRDGTLPNSKLKDTLIELENQTGISIDKTLPHEELIHNLDILAEKVFASFANEETNEVVQMMPWGISGRKPHPRKWYDNPAYLPFETISIPVACDYTEALTQRYGDFMALYKNAGAHNYPYFVGQRENLKKVLDFELPEYRFQRTGQIKQKIDASNSYKATVTECVQTIENLWLELQEQRSGGNDYANDEVLDLIGNIQNLIIDLGNYVESVKGEGYDIVTAIEFLCEKVYTLYCIAQKNCEQFNISDGRNSDVDVREFSDAQQNSYESWCEIKISLLNRKEYIFMPFKPDYFEAFAAEYEAAVHNPNIDVYVVPMPYFYKDYDGVLKDMQYDLEKYARLFDKDIPSDLLPISWMHCNNYDYNLRMPERIYVQYPYDNENPVTGIPPFLRSENLRQYTDELVYMPWFDVAPFTKDNAREYKNMDYYCTVPCVVNADRVVLKDESFKNVYVEKLTEWAGEDTKEIWAKKITVLHRSDDDSANDGSAAPNVRTKKKMLFYISLSLLSVMDSRFLDKWNSIMKTFDENKDKVEILWACCAEMRQLKELNPEGYSIYEAIVEEFNKLGIGRIVNGTTADLVEMADAFYGDPGVLAHEFRNAKKPVMIMNFDVL